MIREISAPDPEQQHNFGNQPAIVVHDVEVNSRQESYYPVNLKTDHGAIECRYYPVEGTPIGAIWVGGVAGGWDAPAKGLYPRLCQDLRTGGLADRSSWGIASLRIQYRYSNVLTEAVLDVLAGLSYLRDQGIKTVALIGHSFGGAVVIQAAASSAMVKTVVTLATQSYGTIPVYELSPHCSILLIHGTTDEVLPHECSESVYQLAQEPKQLILYPDSSHGLDEAAEPIYDTVREWITDQLNQSIF